MQWANSAQQPLAYTSHLGGSSNDGTFRGLLCDVREQSEKSRKFTGEASVLDRVGFDLQRMMFATNFGAPPRFLDCADVKRKLRVKGIQLNLSSPLPAGNFAISFDLNFEREKKRLIIKKKADQIRS